ncbi:MAG: branched-chain amino acid transaminase [Thermoanaerobaculia bacterium]
MASGTIETKTIWMNGKLVDAAGATVPFLTSGFHYGIGVFEGIRCYATPDGPAVFRLREHVERLLDSATCLGFREIPWSADDLIEAVDQTVQANGYDECYIRPLIWLEGGGWNLNIDGGKPGIGIAAWPWNHYLGADVLEKGVRANVSSVTRHHANVTATKAKISGNYVNSFLAKTESVRLGFDEAIMLDPSGYVAECTGANIFLVRDGKIVTPPSALVLEGITRDSILTLASDLGIPAAEKPVSRDQLYIADEVFVCGTAAECVGLREIDFRKIGSGVAGPVTRSLQKAFHAAVSGAHLRSTEWCHLVSAGERPKVAARFGRRG